MRVVPAKSGSKTAGRRSVTGFRLLERSGERALLELVLGQGACTSARAARDAGARSRRRFSTADAGAAPLAARAVDRPRALLRARA